MLTIKSKMKLRRLKPVVTKTYYSSAQSIPAPVKAWPLGWVSIKSNKTNAVGFIITLAFMVLCLNQSMLFAENKENGFEPKYAIITANGVNLRSGASLNFEILGQLGINTKVVVVKEDEDWCKIKLPPAALCFIHKKYVTGKTVIADNLRVRAGAGENFNVLGILNNGDRVNVVRESGDWLQISPTDNCFGWVKKDYLRFTKERFFSCETPPADIDSAQQENQITVLGKVEDVGKIIGRPSSYKLVLPDESFYYLSSENKKIKFKKFNHRKVSVTGTLLESEGCPYPVLNTEQIKIQK